MAKIAIKKASTDVTQYIFVQDSSVTTGAGLTGLTFETASLVCYYVRPLAAAVEIPLVTLALVTTEHTNGGFIEIDSTNMPGHYRIDLPDGICATGVDSVVVHLKGAADMVPVNLEIQLTNFDLNSVTNAVGTVVTATNLTNLPAITADWLTAAGIKADAVTEIQSGLAATTDLTSSSDVWTYGSRTLTQSATSITAAVSGSSITDIRGNDWDIDVTSLTLDSNLIQFTIKRSYEDADAAALLMIDTDTGLLYLNGAAGTAGDGSLSYAGTTLTIVTKASATAQLPPGTYVYGIQSITAAGAVAESYGGTFVITADRVRATT